MIRAIALAAIRVYQFFLSPMLRPACRFAPSCSTYAAICIENFGFAKGLWMSARRLLRCHPFGSSGYDPPPIKGWMDRS